MTKKKPSISVTRALDIEYSEREAGYLMPESDWTRLRKKIKRLKPPTATYMNLGCVFIGVGSTALFVAIGLGEIGGIKHTACWVVSMVALVAGGLLILFHFKSQRSQQEFSEELEDCLNEIEAKFPKHNQTGPQH